MKKAFSLAVALLAALAAAAQENPAAQQSLEQLARNEPLRGAVLGAVVRGADGRIVAAYNPTLRLVPASNLKLVTTGCALHAFGPEHRFRTGLGCTGTLRDGTLEGDVYILGGGDPTLGARDSLALKPEALFWKWKTLLREAGIQRIRGRIVGDGGAYEGMLEHPSWSYDDVGTYYGAGADALSFYENAIDFQVTAGPEGQPSGFVQLYPETPWMHTENASVTGPAGTGNSLYLYTTDLAPYAQLRGSYAADRRPKVEHFANKYGALTCAHEFWKNLRGTGWEVGGYGYVDRFGQVRDASLAVVGPAQTPCRVLGGTDSPRLGDIARETAWRSDNFYAEALLRAMGEAATGVAAYDSCRVAVREVLAGLGVPPEELRLSDGSGLSRRNAASALWLTDFLVAMRKSPAWNAFLESLPRPGQGTLAGISLRDGERIRMKSGSMEGVLCYSGYILGRETLTFSLLTNGTVAPQGEVRAALMGFLEFLLSL